MSRQAIDPARLRYAREHRGLTRGKLAKLAQISPSSVLRYEEGKVSPPLAVLDLLAVHLSVRPEWICGADGEMDTPRLQSFLQNLVTPTQDRPNLFTLVSSILALSPEDRAALLRLLQSEPHPAG